MAHYAFIDSNNVVVKVLTGVDETVTQDDNGTPVGGSTEAWEQFYENQEWHTGLTCKRTSYNATTVIVANNTLASATPMTLRLMCS
jgi:hypothetical protein